MKIDVEWWREMEKVGKGREGEDGQRGRLVKCSEMCTEEEAAPPSSRH